MLFNVMTTLAKKISAIYIEGLFFTKTLYKHYIYFLFFVLTYTLGLIDTYTLNSLVRYEVYRERKVQENNGRNGFNQCSFT